MSLFPSVHPYICLSICRAPYLRNHTSYDCNLLYTCVKWQYLQAFFSFCQNFDFSGYYGVKGQKYVQNDKKFCLLDSISQEQYIIWLSFMVQMCKMMMSQGVFSFFQNFDFLGYYGSKREKKWSKMTKNSIFCAPYLRNHTSCDWQLWYAFVKWLISPGIFFSFFQNLDFLGP